MMPAYRCSAKLAPGRTSSISVVLVIVARPPRASGNRLGFSIDMVTTRYFSTVGCLAESAIMKQSVLIGLFVVCHLICL